MKIKDIQQLEVQNKDTIYLIKDGLFCRAYELSALYFIENITTYQLTKRYYKIIESELVYLGFPSANLPILIKKFKLPEPVECSEFYVINGNFSTQQDFNQWKSSVENKEKEEEEKTSFSPHSIN